MNRHERQLALVTLVALILITALAFAPTVVLYGVIGVWVLSAVIVACWMWWATRRPVSDEERYLAAADDVLERREFEARQVRRLERQQVRVGGGFR